MFRATNNCIHGSLHPLTFRKIPENFTSQTSCDFSQQGEQWQAALFSLNGAFVCGLGWTWGQESGCVWTKGAFLKISGADGPQVSFRDYLTYFKNTQMIGTTCNIFNEVMEEALRNGILHLFCNILISLVPYSYSMLALTYPQVTDISQIQKWGRMGNAWVWGNVGRLVADGGKVTRCHFLEARQEMHMFMQSWQCPPGNTPQTILSHLGFPSCFSIYAFSYRCCCCY